MSLTPGTVVAIITGSSCGVSCFCFAGWYLCVKKNDDAAYGITADLDYESDEDIPQNNNECCLCCKKNNYQRQPLKQVNNTQYGSPLFVKCNFCYGKGTAKKSIKNPIKRCDVCDGLGNKTEKLSCSNSLCNNGCIKVLKTIKKPCFQCLGTKQMKHNIRKPISCNFCNNKGEFEEQIENNIQCNTCDGKGTITETKRCYKCHGKCYSEYITEYYKCKNCNGIGTIRNPRVDAINNQQSSRFVMD
eukprot:203418_1